jgi:hypothetical protein
MSISKFVLYCFFLLNWTNSICAQELIFPDDLIGHYNGELEIFESNGIVKKLDMEIHLDKHNNDTFSYTLKYITDQVVDQRDYFIIKDPHNTHLVKIDEQNGIVLDLEQFCNKWISVFRIYDSQIHFHLTVNENQIVIEVFSLELKDIRLTGGIDDIPGIAILKNSVYQRAVLIKNK